jgi:hypothetical protein
MLRICDGIVPFLLIAAVCWSDFWFFGDCPAPPLAKKLNLSPLVAVWLD